MRPKPNCSGRGVAAIPSEYRRRASRRGAAMPQEVADMLKSRSGRIGLFASALAATFVLTTVADLSADAQDYDWLPHANGNGNGNSGGYDNGYGGYRAAPAAAWGAAAGTAAAIGSTVYSLPAG